MLRKLLFVGGLAASAVSCSGGEPPASLGSAAGELPAVLPIRL